MCLPEWELTPPCIWGRCFVGDYNRVESLIRVQANASQSLPPSMNLPYGPPLLSAGRSGPTHPRLDVSQGFAGGTWLRASVLSWLLTRAHSGKFMSTAFCVASAWCRFNAVQRWASGNEPDRWLLLCRQTQRKSKGPNDHLHFCSG